MDGRTSSEERNDIVEIMCAGVLALEEGDLEQFVKNIPMQVNAHNAAGSELIR